MGNLNIAYVRSFNIPFIRETLFELLTFNNSKSLGSSMNEIKNNETG
jgi:hypothetical protein